MLSAAALHASWNALIKSGGDPFVRLALVNGVSGLIALPALAVVAPPAAAAWPYLVASIVVHHVYYVALAYGYRFGDLSLVYPIARGIAPPLVVLAAWLLAGESPGLIGLLAVLVISGAIVSLAFGHDGRLGDPKTLGFALATGAAIAAYTLCDGLGGRASGDVLGYIAWLFVLDALPFGLLVAWRRRGHLGPALAPRLAPGDDRRHARDRRLRPGHLGDDDHAHGLGLRPARDQRDHGRPDRHPSPARAVRSPPGGRGGAGRRRRGHAAGQPGTVERRTGAAHRLAALAAVADLAHPDAAQDQDQRAERLDARALAEEQDADQATAQTGIR